MSSNSPALDGRTRRLHVAGDCPNDTTVETMRGNAIFEQVCQTCPAEPPAGPVHP
jgi:hypothetical protein